MNGLKVKKHILIIGNGLAGSLLSNELVKTHQVTMLEKVRNRGTINAINFTSLIKSFNIADKFSDCLC